MKKSLIDQLSIEFQKMNEKQDNLDKEFTEDLKRQTEILQEERDTLKTQIESRLQSLEESVSTNAEFRKKREA